MVTCHGLSPQTMTNIIIFLCGRTMMSRFLLGTLKIDKWDGCTLLFQMLRANGTFNVISNHTSFLSSQNGLLDRTTVQKGNVLFNVLLLEVRDVVVQWLVRWIWDLKVESTSPGQCIHVVF